MHPMSKKEKKPEDVTPEEQTEQAVPTEETEAEAPNPLLEELEARKMLDRAAMVENCGLPEERPFADLMGKPDSNGYFTTVIIP